LGKALGAADISELTISRNPQKERLLFQIAAVSKWNSCVER
jgi:hypothetical protein